MGELVNCISTQLNSLKANYSNRKPPGATLVLVNYMPVLRFIEPYEEITYEEVQELIDKGFPPPVERRKYKDKDVAITSLPSVSRVPGYAFYANVSLELKNTTTAYVVFKRSPRTPDPDIMIKVGEKYYRNPNIVNLATVIHQYYSTSIIGKYFTGPSVEWTLADTNNSIVEMRSYNYISSDFTILLDYRNVTNVSFKLDDAKLKLLNTYLFIAQMELGHYFSLYRKKYVGHGTLAYCYNNEFLPIYYGFGLKSVLNDISPKGVPWIEVLIEQMQPPEELLSQYVSLPECCKYIVVRDDKVYRDINGIELSNYTTTPVYYMTRQDVHLVGQQLTTPNTENTLNKEDYSYRHMSPYLLDSLFRNVFAQGIVIPEYHSPNNWLAKVCSVSSGDYISFDVVDPGIASETAYSEVPLSYSHYATLMHYNYISHTETQFHYSAYVNSNERTFRMLDTADFNVDKKSMLINFYATEFLDKFFK